MSHDNAELLPVHEVISSSHGYSRTKCGIYFRFWNPVQPEDTEVSFEPDVLIDYYAPETIGYSVGPLSWTWNKSKITCSRCRADVAATEEESAR